MANRFGMKLQNRLPNLTGVYPFSAPITTTNSVFYSYKKSRIVGKRRAFIPRRVVLGIGISVWSQFMSMAANVGGKSFMASASQKSAIEQVIKFFIFQLQPMLDFG